VALLSADLERYAKATEIYESVARASLNHALLQWSASDHFLRACLCCLASQDVVSARRSLERYRELDPRFSDQRECKFLEVDSHTFVSLLTTGAAAHRFGVRIL
ncbi:Soluble NSF attachment protein (SNAP), partial [uncultured virus]